MKSIDEGAILLFLVLTFSCACNRNNVQPPDRPRLTPQVTMRDVNFQSASLGRKMQYRVLLPANAGSAKLPVVYLLHGGGGGFRDWSNYSDVARFAERRLILVMPEGHSSYYTNSATRPKDRYEDYIVKDLISDVESRFPVARGRANRALVGVSMGGFGAVKIALTHPEVYAFAGGISSAIDVPRRPFSIKRPLQWEHHRSIFGEWGSDTRRENDPFTLAETAAPSGTPFLYLTCGEQEGLLPANRQFAALLRKRGFAHTFQTAPGGHDWNQWDRKLPDLFQSLIEKVGEH